MIRFQGSDSDLSELVVVTVFLELGFLPVSRSLQGA
jgi:hypothetical protein